MKPTQQQIADHFQLSKATISRALKDDPGIGKSTREEIARYAKKIGYTYVPSVKQVTSKMKGSREILLLTNKTPGEGDESSSAVQTPWKIIQGMSYEAQKKDVSLAIHNISHDDLHHLATVRNQPPSMREKRANAIVIWGFGKLNASSLSWIHDWNTVLVNNALPQESVDVVDADTNEAVSLAVEHLKQLKHQRIGFFCNRQAPRHNRFSGFARAMGIEQLPFGTEDVVNVFTHLEPAACFKRIEKRVKAGVRAWVCAQPMEAQDLADYLEAKGYRIPQDVSLITFQVKDYPQVTRKFSSIELPSFEIGRQSIIQCLIRIQAPDAPYHKILLPCRYEPDETTAICSQK